MVDNGAFVSLCNKYGQTPLEKAQRHLAQELEHRARQLDQDLTKIQYQSQVWPVGPTRPNTIRMQDKHNDIDMKVNQFPSRPVLILYLGIEYPGENQVMEYIRLAQRALERFGSGR